MSERCEERRDLPAALGPTLLSLYLEPGAGGHHTDPVTVFCKSGLETGDGLLTLQLWGERGGLGLSGDS